MNNQAWTMAHNSTVILIKRTQALSWVDAGNDMPYEDHTKRLLKSKKRTRANDSNQIYKSHNIKFLKGYVLIESNLNVLLTYS